VLTGAMESIGKIEIVVLKMSLVLLYSGQVLFSALMDKMKDFGYSLSILEPCDEDYKTFTILQMDGWFVRS
jgi:hypothetical protein